MTQYSPKDVGLLAISAAQDLGSDVLAVALRKSEVSVALPNRSVGKWAHLALKLLRNVAVALGADPALARLGAPSFALPAGAGDVRAADDADRVRARPSRREAKVANLEVSVLGDEDVRGLEVEVDDVARVEVLDRKSVV